MSIVDCGECRTQGCEEGHCRNATPTKEQQAAALARSTGHGAYLPTIEAWTFNALQLAAFLADHEQQVREDERQRLAQQSGVMPPDTRTDTHIDTMGEPAYTVEAHREAIATMQVQLAAAQKLAADRKEAFDAATLVAEKYHAELEQVREQTRREVLEEAATVCDNFTHEEVNVAVFDELAEKIRSLK